MFCEFMEIFVFLGIDLSINQEGCEMLAVIILIRYIVRYGMIAHFFKRFHSILGFAKRHLVSGDHPMIKGYPVMMEH